MILVTGGMGFIGMHTVKALLDAGEQVVPTSHRAWRTPELWGEAAAKRVIPERLDINNAHDAIEVVRKHGVTAIIHLAGPPFAGTTAAADYATNQMGLLNLLEAARINGVRRFVYASSNAVYGGLPGGPYHEEMLLPPASTSAISAYKKAGEIVMMHYADRTGLGVAAVRPPAVYGPLYYSMVNLMGRFSHAAARGTEPDYGAAGPPRGGDMMDMAYVKDVAEIFARAAIRETLSHRVYNAGYGRAFSYQELLDAVRKVVPAARVALSAGGGQPPLTAANHLDMSRVRDDLGFAPRYDLEAGIADYIRWLGDNPQ